MRRSSSVPVRGMAQHVNKGGCVLNAYVGNSRSPLARIEWAGLVVLALAAGCSESGRSMDPPAEPGKASQAVSPAAAGRLELLVRDSATGVRLAAMARYTTPAEGERELDLAPRGRAQVWAVVASAPIPVTVAAPGYRASSTEIEVNPERALPVTFWLDPEQTAAELRPEVVDAQLRPGHTLLHGHVVDVLDGHPVAGARVTARNASMKTETDSRGYFMLVVPARPMAADGLPDTEDLEIAAPGYKTYLLTRTALLEGSDTHFIIDLEQGAGTSGRDDTHHVLADTLGPPVERVAPASPGAREAVGPAAATGLEMGIATLLPSTVPVPTNVKVGTSCSCTSCSAVSVYSLENYVKYGLNDEWYTTWTLNSLKTGAVAYRSYGSYYALVGRISSSYDICNNTCCQVLDTDTTTTGDYLNALSGTTWQILSPDSRSAARSEYASETNHFSPCADGYTGDGSGWSCLSDSVCLGTTPFGHGRGLCQFGSQRWSSSQLKDYTWILDHYYNANGYPSGSRSVYRKAGSTACLGSANDAHCNNFDPVGSGCSYDGTTPTGAKVAIANSVGSTLGWVELRWSSACGSNWARVSSNIGSTSMTGTVKRDNGVSYSYTQSGTSMWSTDIYSPVRASQACGTISGYTKCTAWY